MTSIIKDTYARCFLYAMINLKLIILIFEFLAVLKHRKLYFMMLSKVGKEKEIAKEKVQKCVM